MLKLDDKDGWKLFVHPANIQYGKGRILWGTKTEKRGKVFEEGWVLPGGERTTDPKIAFAYAQWINEQAQK